MNVMITGCAGFIGSHAVEYFLKKGDTVVGVDSMTYAASLDNLAEISGHDNFIFYVDNICNTASMVEYCKYHSIEWVINFAAESHVDNSIDSCSKFIKSNIDGVRSILDCCRETGAKLFQISTDEVYGSIGHGSFFESSSLNPKNPYSATKAAAEHLINAYSNTYNMDYITVRMSNNFGPRQHPEKFIPTILRSLSENIKIPVYGDGKNVRDWFYVKDCVKMVRRVLLTGTPRQVYNLTHRNEKTNIEIVSKICNALDKNMDDVVSFVPDRPGHDFRYSISNKKVTFLGIENATNFNDAILETINFYTEK
jgi:dTDP-glucose 4,6-dehydratase